MSDLHYRITRNSETLASYRAWSKAAWADWLWLVGFGLGLLRAAGVLGGEALVDSSALFLGTGAVLCSLGAAALGVSLGAVALHKRRHPWTPT
ncbi:hypothetical protein BH09PSE2_BH09PSE2_00840 [soil metagenome]